MKLRDGRLHRNQTPPEHHFARGVSLLTLLAQPAGVQLLLALKLGRLGHLGLRLNQLRHGFQLALLVALRLGRSRRRGQFRGHGFGSGG